MPVKSSRGAAFDDLDGDGRVDAAITNARQAVEREPAEGYWRLLERAARAAGAEAEAEAAAREAERAAAE